MSGSLKALKSRIVLPACVSKHDNMVEENDVMKTHKRMPSASD